MSSYSAEYAKGPVIFQAFSKQRRKSVPRRRLPLHAQQRYSTRLTTLTPKARAEPTAAQQYYYMGGNIGGPVRFPFLSFNHNRDKLFFWGRIRVHASSTRPPLHYQLQRAHQRWNSEPATSAKLTAFRRRPWTNSGPNLRHPCDSP